MSDQKNLFFDRRYYPLFWTQFFGAFNDNFYKNALVILITFKAYKLGGLGPEQMVALCGGVFILPFFLFSALAGEISDKFAKHKIVVWTKYAELLVMAVGAIGFLREDIILLLITLFFMGLQSTIFGPVKYSALPEILSEDELVKGNAYIESGTFVAILLGTIVGGTTILLPSIGAKVTAFGVCFIAIIGIMTSLKMKPLKEVAPGTVVHLNLLTSTWNMIKLSRDPKSVFLSILGISWFWFVGAAFLSVLPPYCKTVLQGNESMVTFFLAIFSVGVGVGSILCEILSKGKLELGLVPIGSIGMTLFIADLYFIPAFTEVQTVTSLLQNANGLRIMFDMLMFSIFSGFFTVPLYTFIQSRSQKEIRSQVIAANNIINAFFMVVSAVLLMALYSFGFSIADIFLTLAVLNAFAAIYIYSVIPEFMYRFICFILANIIYRLKIIDAKKIPENGPAVIVSNHVSFIDWLIIASITHRPIRFVMHYSFMKIPIAGKFFRDSKVIPIAGMKEDPALMEKAFKEVKKVLDEGELVCIFPEGFITSDGEIALFRPGIERIINETPVPVIPIRLDGLWGSFFSRKDGRAMRRPFRRFWSRIQVIIGDAVLPQNVKADSLREKVLALKE